MPAADVQFQYLWPPLFFLPLSSSSYQMEHHLYPLSSTKKFKAQRLNTTLAKAYNLRQQINEEIT